MKLFSPIKIKNLELANRIVMAPICTNYSDGHMDRRTTSFLLSRAIGPGLIQFEAAPVVYPQGKNNKNMFRIDSDEFIPVLAKMIGALKKVNPKLKCSIQIYHAGARTTGEISGAELVAASAIAIYPGWVPRALTKPEIKEVLKKTAEAAVRVKKAGFDAVNIHFAHGYLTGNFISARTNARSDEYGGSFENRTRICRETLEYCREAVGDDFPLMVRMNSRDFIEGGQTFEEAKALAQMSLKYGADVLDISGTVAGTDDPKGDLSMAGERCLWVEYARQIKELTGAPVITVGRIMTPENAENILHRTNIDLVAFARPFIADAEFAKKAAHGRSDDIRPCIACNQGCYDHLMVQKKITCLVNPAVGLEHEFKLTAPRKKKGICVIGAGPAGINAALLASQRGHDVTLIEKGPTVGGQLNLAGLPPYREELKNIIAYYDRQLKKSRVDLLLEKEATEQLIDDIGPDSVVVAAGPLILDQKIRGIDGSQFATVIDVLKGEAQCGERCIVACSAFCCGNRTYYGCETLEYLAVRGKRATLITPKCDILEGIGVRRLPIELTRMRDLGIRIVKNAKIVQFLENRLIVEREGAREVYDCDTFILGNSMRSNEALAGSLKARGYEVFSIGTCRNPKDNALDAVKEGYRIGYEI